MGLTLKLRNRRLSREVGVNPGLLHLRTTASVDAHLREAGKLAMAAKRAAIPAPCEKPMTPYNHISINYLSKYSCVNVHRKVRSSRYSHEDKQQFHQTLQKHSKL